MEALQITKGDSQDDLAEEANRIIAEAKMSCEDRGEGFKPRHIYLEGSTRCVCTHGPDLAKERLK